SNPNHIPSPPIQPEKVALKNIINNVFEFKEEVKSSESIAIEQTTPQPTFSPPTTTRKLRRIIQMSDLNKSQYQKLNANNSKITKAHTAFL
ncbi:hypothetical protein, partial [Trichormus variabilis]